MRLCERVSAHASHMLAAFTVVNTVFLGDLLRNRFWSVVPLWSPLATTCVTYAVPVVVGAAAVHGMQRRGKTAAAPWAAGMLMHPLIDSTASLDGPSFVPLAGEGVKGVAVARRCPAATDVRRANSCR
eukprot:4598523-Prymnesium_polylepis.1